MNFFYNCRPDLTVFMSMLVLWGTVYFDDFADTVHPSFSSLWFDFVVQ